MKRCFEFLLALCLACPSAGFARTIESARELTSAIDANDAIGTPFSLSGKITFRRDTRSVALAIEDDSGNAFIHGGVIDGDPISAGDTVNVQGTIRPASNELSRIVYSFAEFTNYTIITRGPIPIPHPVLPEDIINGKCRAKLVEVTGFVKDTFRDEIDPKWSYVVLNVSGRTLYVASFSTPDEGHRLGTLVGSNIRVCGIGEFVSGNGRRNTGCLLITGGPEHFIALDGTSDDPFKVPVLPDFGTLTPDAFGNLGRHRVTGHVIAVWNKSNLLLECANGEIVGARLESPTVPSPGCDVELSGFPETDLYHINLSRCLWRTARTSAPEALGQPEAVSIDYLTSDTTGQPRFQYRYHGRLIQLQGLVRDIPSSDRPQMTLETGSKKIPVYLDTCPEVLFGILPGTYVETTGICLMENSGAHIGSITPRITGVALVLRTNRDIRILRRPSWWTPTRLLFAIVLLIFFALAVLLWNFSLRIKVERKGRELTHETLSRVEAELRADERTRLAIELHDTLAQNLTGASMQIKTALRLVDRGDTGFRQHLDIAKRAIDSFRRELRNCLWDLRNNSLDAADMTSAIRKALMPILGQTSLTVRFEIPRDLLTERTAHALMRIVRELVVNAITHGAAQKVKIAGSIENNRLYCSVQDDGIGFDESMAPGSSLGHYGLQGIRERLREFHGTLQIRKLATKGTKAVFSFNLPDNTRTRQDQCPTRQPF